MNKFKAVVVVILLVGGGGAGALFGLNSFYQARIDNQVQSALGGADKQLVEHLRVQAFLAIQRLSRESQSSELLTAMNRARPVAEGTAAEAVKSALQPAHDALLPLLESIQKKTKSGSLFAISSDGRVAAKLPQKDSFGESLKGLPAVKECLGGISRDGFYEIGGKPLAVAVTPVMDGRSRVAGCLMSADPLDSTKFAALAKDTGTQFAVFLRKAVVASTMDRSTLQPIIPQLNSSEIIRFGDPSTDSPIMADFSGKGYAARSVKIEGGTDALHLAVILPLADMIAPLREAQMTLFMGVGALLIIGLLLGFLLSAKSDSHEAERLRDAVRNLSDGSTSSLNVNGYSGAFQDLAYSIDKLVSGGPRPVSAKGNGIGAQPTLESEPPVGPEPSDLDFESLLGGGAPGAAPAKTEPPLPETPVIEPEPAPAESAPPELPAELFAPTPTPAPAEPEPPAAAPAAPVMPAEAAAPAPASGPRVELPGELAGMFDEDTVEATSMPPPAPAEPTPPPPPSIPPMPPDLGEDQAQITSSDYRPDATVIAQVPDELLKAAFTMEQQNSGAPAGAPEPSPIRAVEEPPEDSHFREVFQQFIDTKKQCGESTVGLTFDRFAEKLRKNTADLKDRYKCRTVKFHVYVKNGKAALKATPLK